LGLRWKDVDKDVIPVAYQYTRAGKYEEPKTEAGRRRVPLSDDAAAFFEARKFAGSIGGTESL
jgi:hypothetical protein